MGGYIETVDTSLVLQKIRIYIFREIFDVTYKKTYRPQTVQ